MTTEPNWYEAPEGATHCRAVARWWYKQTDRAYEWRSDRWVLIANDLGEFHWANELIERPDTWTGDGLPPVGTVCEVLNPELSRAEWEKCTVLFVGKHRILYDSESCSERCGYVETLEFRPIRTPEQIAEEERSKACYAIYGILCGVERPGNRSDMAEALYDAGYRKQEAV